MGHRTLKRVPLDFKWPLHKVWKGYINPFPGPKTCKICDGSGYNTATKQIADDFYDRKGMDEDRWNYLYGVGPDRRPAIRPPWLVVGECRAWHAKITQDEVKALVTEGRLKSFTHILDDDGWKLKKWDTKGFWCSKCFDAVPQLSPEHHTCYCTECNREMTLLEGNDIRLHTPIADIVNEWEDRGGIDGHDAINRWILIKTRAKRLGVFGKCPKCKGRGEIKLPRKIKKMYNKWKECEPPTGKGYQLWETTTEGSPISPVFASAEELAKWCAKNATIFGDEKTSYENWLVMFIGDDDVDMGSLIVVQSGFVGAVINAPNNT